MCIEPSRLIDPVGPVSYTHLDVYKRQQLVGKFFGPIMFTWFSMIGFLGLLQIIEHPQVLQALNPVYAIELLAKYPGGFWILGAVFLCTTGGEALYSDLGHCGKQNVRMSWSFVLIALLLSYFGQSAYLISNHEGQVIVDLSLIHI